MESIPGGRARARHLGNNRKLIRAPKTMMYFPDLSGSVFTLKACTMVLWLIDALNRIGSEKSVHAAMQESVCLRAFSRRLIHPCAFSSQDLERLSRSGRPHSKPILRQTCQSQLQRLIRSSCCSEMILKVFCERPIEIILKGFNSTNSKTVLTTSLTTGGL